MYKKKKTTEKQKKRYSLVTQRRVSVFRILVPLSVYYYYVDMFVSLSGSVGPTAAPRQQQYITRRGRNNDDRQTTDRKTQ